MHVRDAAPRMARPFPWQSTMRPATALLKACTPKAGARAHPAAAVAPERVPVAPRRARLARLNQQRAPEALGPVPRLLQRRPLGRAPHQRRVLLVPPARGRRRRARWRRAARAGGRAAHALGMRRPGRREAAFAARRLGAAWRARERARLARRGGALTPRSWPSAACGPTARRRPGTTSQTPATRAPRAARRW